MVQLRHPESRRDAPPPRPALLPRCPAERWPCLCLLPCVGWGAGAAPGRGGHHPSRLQHHAVHRARDGAAAGPGAPAAGGHAQAVCGAAQGAGEGRALHAARAQSQRPPCCRLRGRSSWTGPRTVGATVCSAFPLVLPTARSSPSGLLLPLSLLAASTCQVDLAREASNLQRFNFNFRHTPAVQFPVPLYPLVSSEVLVETYEEGDHISRCEDFRALGHCDTALRHIATLHCGAPPLGGIPERAYICVPCTVCACASPTRPDLKP